MLVLLLQVRKKMNGFAAVKQVVWLIFLFALGKCAVAQTDSGDEGAQLLDICNGIVTMIRTELVGPYQFSGQIQYLSGLLMNYPINKPLINVTSINISVSTTEIMQGLFVTTSAEIVGVSLTLSSGSYVSFTKDIAGIATITTRAANSTCQVSGKGLGGNPYLVSEEVLPCNPSKWDTYTAAVAHGYGAYSAPALGQTQSAFGQVAVMPYSVPLTDLNTGEVYGVVTTNITLSSVSNLFSFPNTVYYVMTSAAEGYLLVFNSVGESLNSNNSLFPAYKATNLVIRKSAQYIASLASIPNEGAHYLLPGATNKSASLILAVAPCSDGTRTLNLLVVTVTYVPASFFESSNDTCKGTAAVKQSSLNGPSLVASILTTDVTILLRQIISFGESMAFLAGSGAPLSLSPYPVQLRSNDTNSQQILRGMMAAYGFPYGNDYVFETALVEDSSGDYAGYTVTNAMFTVNATCAELYAMDGTVYPAINQSCLLVYFTDIYGSPMEPAFKQFPYDVRTQAWYQRVKTSGRTSTYGTILEPTAEQQGVAIAVPVYNDNNEFIGAVEMFMQSVVLTRRTSPRGVNVSYLMSAEHSVIGTSEDPIATLTSLDGAPIAAVNFSDPIVAASAKFIVDNAINWENVFFYPYSDKVIMQLAIAHAKITTRSAINWMVVSVTLYTLSDEVDPVIPVDPVVPVVPTSDESSHTKNEGLFIAAVTLGSLGLVCFVVFALYLFLVYYYWQPRSAPTSNSAPRELELGATTNPMQ